MSADDEHDPPRPPPVRQRWDTATESVVMPLSQRWRQVVRASTSQPAPPSSSLPLLQPGMRVGRYQLVTQIARGGMATVWVAFRQHSDGRREVVALKVLLPHLVGEASFVSMFLDEARLLSKIQHPNVVAIRDVGTDTGLPYVALEWVDGDALSSLLKALHERGKDVPLSFALRVVGECCRGLHAAHELRDVHGRPLEVVHRDISPSNMLISAEGDVKLIDFGVARAAQRLSEQTRSGVLKGKVSYMAPEQVLRGPIDRRTDIWSAGVVLYRLVAGQMPYPGSLAQVLLHIKHGDTVRPLPAHAPRAVAQIVHRAMTRNPDERFQTAAEMRLAIQSAYADVCAPLPRYQLGQFLVTQLGARLQERRAALSAALGTP